MSGGTEPRAVVALNTGADPGGQLRGGPCRAYMQDKRVQVRETGLYTYPDVVVACRDPRFAGKLKDALLNPTSSKYCRLRPKPTTTVKSSSIIKPSTPCRNTCSYRTTGCTSTVSAAGRLEDAIALDSIGCTLRLADIYEDMDLPAAEVGAPSASQSA